MLTAEVKAAILSHARLMCLLVATPLALPEAKPQAVLESDPSDSLTSSAREFFRLFKPLAEFTATWKQIKTKSRLPVGDKYGQWFSDNGLSTIQKYFYGRCAYLNVARCKVQDRE